MDFGKLPGAWKAAIGVGAFAAAAFSLTVKQGDDPAPEEPRMTASALPAPPRPAAERPAVRGAPSIPWLDVIAALPAQPPAPPQPAAAAAAPAQAAPPSQPEQDADPSVWDDSSASDSDATEVPRRGGSASRELAPAALSSFFGSGAGAGGGSGPAAGANPAVAAQAVASADRVSAATPARPPVSAAATRALGLGEAALQSAPQQVRPFGHGVLSEALVQSIVADARSMGPLPPLASVIAGGSQQTSEAGTGTIEPGSVPASTTQNPGGASAGGGSGAGATGGYVYLGGVAPAAAPGSIPWTAKASVTGLLFPDVYEYNAISSWDKLSKASHGIIAMKVRQTQIQFNLVGRLKAAEKRKMIVIGYAFGYGIDGGAQADAFVKNFPLQPGRVMALDYEHNDGGPSMTQSQAVAFAERIFRRTGKLPLFYASRNAARPGILRKCPQWVADWSSDRPTGAVAWQFTDGVKGPGPHHFPGMSKPGDIDRLMITYAGLRKLAGLDSTQPK